MPKSRIRRKGEKKAGKQPDQPKSTGAGPSPVWVAPLMIGLFAVGLIWIVIYYVSNADLPIEALGNGNLLVGFAFIIGGFITSTQWR